MSPITHGAGNRLQRISTAAARRPNRQTSSEKLKSNIRGVGVVALKHASSKASRGFDVDIMTRTHDGVARVRASRCLDARSR